MINVGDFWMIIDNSRRTPSFNRSHGRSRTVNQQGAQVAIASLADPEQHCAATAGTMAWNQSEISCELAPAFELSGVAYRSHQCGRD